MLTDAQIAANRKSASNIIKIQLNLDQTPNSDWTYEQRTQYDKALAQYILAHPAAFGNQDIQTAQKVSSTDYTPLDNTNFSFTDFGNEVATNANDLIGKPLVNLGNSVSGAVNFLGSVGPWLAVAGVIFIGYMFVRAKGAQVAK